MWWDQGWHNTSIIPERWRPAAANTHRSCLRRDLCRFASIWRCGRFNCPAIGSHLRAVLLVVPLLIS